MGPVGQTTPWGGGSATPWQEKKTKKLKLKFMGFGPRG
jgi:hypothetical protein